MKICRCKAPKPKPYAGSQRCAECEGRFMGALTARLKYDVDETAQVPGLKAGAIVTVLEHRDVKGRWRYVVSFDEFEFEVDHGAVEWP